MAGIAVATLAPPADERSPTRPDPRVLGILFGLAAAALAGFVAILVHVSAATLPAPEIAFGRSVFGPS
jgi:hypothetical protein